MGTNIRLLTLVDITATGVIRSNGSRDLERNQQRNFETVLQVLGLRTQPHIVRYPEVHEIDKEDPAIWFGDLYHDAPQRIWSLYFTADHISAYDNEQGTLEGLRQDFEQVPVVTCLTETAKFILPILHPHGSIKNIHISIYPTA
jgi:hypothetical protein